MRSLKITWEKIYLICIFYWSLFATIVNESYIEIPSITYVIAWSLIKILLLLKIFFYDAKRTPKFVFSIAIVCIGVLSTYCSESLFLEPFFWFLAAANFVDVRDIIKALFKAQLLSFCLIVTLSLFGLIESNNFFRDNSNLFRYSFGFMHPNSFAQKAFQICAMYIYLTKEKLALKHCIAILSVQYVVYRYSVSNTSWYLTLMLLFLIILYFLSNGKKTVISRLSSSAIKFLRYLCMILAGFSIYLALNYDDSNIILNITPKNTMISRFSQMYIYFKTYDIKPFGQKLYYHGSDTALTDQVLGLYTLDNAYIYLLLGFGIVVFVLFLTLYIWAMYTSVKEKRYIELILMTVYLIYGFAETGMIRFTYNFTMVFMFLLIYRQSFLDKDNQ